MDWSNPGWIVAALALGVGLGTGVMKLGRWGGNQETVRSTLEQGLQRVEALVIEVRDELRDDFQQLREQVNDMALTLATHGEAIQSLKEDRRRGR